MLGLVVIWCGFWGALALVLGASTSVALLMAFGSVVVPLLLLGALALLLTVAEEISARRNRKRAAQRRRDRLTKRDV